MSTTIGDDAKISGGASVAGLAELANPASTIGGNRILSTEDLGNLHGSKDIGSAIDSANSYASVNPVEVQNTAVGSERTLNIVSNNTSNLEITGVNDEANGKLTIYFDAKGSGGGSSANYQADVYANNTLVLANAAPNFNNTATVNVAITADGTTKANIALNANIAAIVGPTAATINAAVTVALDDAEAAYAQANLAYTRANTANIQGNNAYTQANSAYAQANLAYAAANSAQTASANISAGAGITVSANIVSVNVSNNFTWTGEHIFEGDVARDSTVDGVSIGVIAGYPIISFNDTSGAANCKYWEWLYEPNNFIFRTSTDDLSNFNYFWTITRAGANITSMVYGNAGDLPTHKFWGDVETSYNLTVDNNLIVTGTANATTLNVSSNVYAGNVLATHNFFTLNGGQKGVVEDADDGYLRLNPFGDFTNGVYTPDVLRVDGNIQCNQGGAVYTTTIYNSSNVYAGNVIAGYGGSAPNGVNLYRGTYGYGDMFVLGSLHSSGATFMAYGMGANTGNNDYLSTITNLSLYRYAIDMGQGMRFWAGASQNVASGSPVSADVIMVLDTGGINVAGTLNATGGIVTAGDIDAGGIIKADNYFYAESYNQIQMLLDSPGTYWGCITCPSGDLWTLGWANGVNRLDSNGVSLAWTANGRVGINMSTPGYALDVAGDANVSGNLFSNGASITLGGSNYEAAIGLLGYVTQTSEKYGSCYFFQNYPAGAANNKLWALDNDGQTWSVQSWDDSGSYSKDAITITKVSDSYALSSITYGNSIDLPTHNVWGDANVSGNVYANNLTGYSNTGTITGDLNLDCAKGSFFDYTLASNPEITLQNCTTNGTTTTIQLLLRQSANGGNTVTFANTIYWSDNATPTLSTTANTGDVLQFTTFNGGVMWMGAQIYANMAGMNVSTSY